MRRCPALVAAITVVYRTWLDPRSPAKASVAAPRKALGRVCGRAVWFARVPADGLAALLVGGDIGTALSTGSLGAFAPPPGLARPVIARDYDVAAVGLPALRARLAPLFRYAGGEDSLHEGDRWRAGEGAPQWDVIEPT